MAPNDNPNLWGGVGAGGGYGPNPPAKVGGAIPAGSSNGWKMDLSGLKDLESQLGKIISQFNTLDAKIKSVNGGLGGTKLGSSVGSSTTSLTASPVTAINTALGKTTASAAQFGGQTAGFGGGGKPAQPGGGGPGGPMNTTAMFGGSAFAYAAGAEVLGQVGGYINQKMGALQAGGVPVQLTAAQFATTSGGSTFGNVQGYNRIQSTGQADQAAAMQMQLQNPFLSTLSPGTKRFNNVRGFVNATTALGSGSAQNSMGLLSALTSNQAQWFFQNRTGGQGGPLDPRTGLLRNPQTAFQTTLQAASGTPLTVTGNQLTSRLKDIANNSGHWAVTANNLQQIGLNPAQISLLHEFAATGGNLGKATGGPISKTQYASLLNRTTQGAATANDITQTTTGLQNALNNAAASAQKFAQTLNGMFPGITQGGVLGAHGLGTGAQVASNVFMGKALLKAMGKGKVATPGETAAPGLAMRAAGLGADAGVAGGGPVAAAAAATALQTDAMAHGHTLDPLGIGQLKRGHLPGWFKAINPVSVGSKIGGAIENLFGDPVGTSGMQPNLAHGLTAMKQANPNIQINSGYRTQTQQAALYAAKGGQGVARPGQSPHQLGKAADIGPPSQFGWIAANASKYGLASDRNEPWHVQAMGDPNTASSITGAQVVSGATTQLGVNYVYGGETPGKAMDCSGLVQYVYGQLGISLPRTTYQQVKAGSPVASLAKAQPGDLLFYAGSDGTASNPGHVAIYIGGGKQIAAPHTGTKVQVQAVQTSAVVAIRRIVGGGGGQGVVAAAQGAVGMPSNDASNHGTASAPAGAGGAGLSNTFVATLSSSWLSGGGGGGGTGTGTTGASSTLGGTSSPGASVSGSANTASSGSTAIVGGAGGGAINSPTAFSKAVLTALGLPATMADVTSLNAWQQQEGQWGSKGIYNAMQMHDPLNTNLPEKGGHSLGGTWYYPDWATGVQATVSTIKQGNMSAIYKALQANDNLSSFSTAAESTPWASSAYGGKSFGNPSGVYAVGDPVGGFQPMSGSAAGGGTSGPVSALRGGGRGGINVTLGPFYVQGTQADANNIASMVAAAIKNNTDMQSMAGS